MLAVLSVGDAIALVGLLLVGAGMLGGVAKWIIGEIRDVEKNTREDIAEVRKENNDAHNSTDSALKALANSLPTHIAVDHAKIIEAMARMEERQEALMTRARKTEDV